MIIISISLFLLAISLSDVLGKIYFEDRFLNTNIDQWSISGKESEKLGKCEFSRPIPVFDEKEDGGMNTTEPARFYRYSAPFKKTFKNKDKNMCVQFSVKYPQGAECSGAYIKLMGENFNASEFHGETPYEIMFGPDICGYNTRLVHVIFSHKEKNHLLKEKIPFFVDDMMHLFTLHVFPNNTFEVFVDRVLKKNGSLADYFDMPVPKMITDPDSKKPVDWVDKKEIPDPEDSKPDDWDQPETIVDPSDTKPNDWNEETDGKWTPRLIKNPKYKGEWRPKMIPNPEYKGTWKPRQIINPDFVDDPNLYSKSLAYIGIDLWQVQSGTLFDNFIISDDLSECANHAKYWKKRFDAEAGMMQKNLEEKGTSSDKTQEEEGEDDRISTLEQSIIFDDAMKEAGEFEEESGKSDEDEKSERKEKNEGAKKVEKPHEEL